MAGLIFLWHQPTVPPAQDAGGRGRRRNRHLPYRPGEREERGLRFEKRDRDAEILERMQRAYARAMGETEPTPAAVEAVRPHVVASSDVYPVTSAAIDWQALLNDLAAVQTLLALYEQQIEDEDMMVVLLLS